jgi:hypothetical protein
MKKHAGAIAQNAVAAWAAGLLTLSGAAAWAAALEPAGTVEMDGVHGRIDHFAYDPTGQRLFMAALGNDTVEVIDVAALKRLKTLTGEKEPQGMRYLAQEKKLVVATGEGGTVDFFAGDGLKLIKRLSGYDDADNVRIDPKTNEPVVGWGSGALTWFSADGAVTGTTKLPAHPESFQFSPSRRRVYVNVPGAGKVCVVDADSHKLIESWPLSKASANYPMALDDGGGFLFVACRPPSSIIVFDLDHGKEIGRVSTSGDADDIFYDPATRLIYESCGEGYIDVFQHDGHGGLKRVEAVATAHGARTSFYVPELHRLFLAVPHRGNQRCEVRVFKAM